MDLTTTPATDDATKLDDYTRLRDAGRGLASAMAGVVAWQGGALDEFEESLTAVTLRNAFGDAGAEIDGTHLGLVAAVGGSVVLEVVAIRHPDSAGTVTCTVDLYNVTAAAVVASSSVAISLTTAAATHQKSGALTLPTSVQRYRVRILTSDATRAVAAIARVVVKGA